MKKVALYTIYLYFLICPIEFTLNRYFGSSVKYIAIVAAAFMLMFFIGSRRVPMRFGSIQICIGAWALLEASSYLWTIHSGYTLNMLITYIMMAVLVFAVSIFPFEKKELEGCFIAYLIGCLLLSALLFTIGVTTARRMTLKILGTYQDPNSIAAILLSGASFAFYKTFQKPARSIVPNIIYGICFTVITAAIFATGSRGGLIAYILAILVYIIVIIPKQKRLKILIMVPLVLLILYLILRFTISQITFDRLFDFDSYTGGNGRIHIWTTALQEIVKNPLFGHGVFSHQGYFYEQFGRTLAMHNTFLFLLFEVGIIGFSLFIFPYIKTFLYAAKNKNAMICAVIISNVIAAFFLDALNHRYLWNALMFGLIFYNINHPPKKLKN